MAGLRVNIEGLRFRASDGKLGAADQLRIVKQRLSGLAASSLRAGDPPAALAEIINQRQPLDLTISTVEIDAISETAVARKPRLEPLKMIDVPSLPFRVAKGVVPGSLSNGRTVAAEINKQNPGSKLRVPTEAELLKVNELLGDQLENRDYWIWTETEHKDYPGQFVLRLQYFDSCLYDLPGLPFYNYAVRFVEDK